MKTSFVKKISKFIIITLALLASLVVLYYAINPDVSPKWTGFGKSFMNEKILPSKTLWDWLDLLLIPLFITLTGWYLARNEKTTEIKRANEITQRESLKAYLEVITTLLLEHKLRNSKSGSEIRSIARARTINLIHSADSLRKGIVLQFLFEAALISTPPIIDLLGVKFSDTNLNKIKLVNVEITGANFENCNLKNSNLIDCNFSASKFNGSNLSNCILDKSNFTYSDMIGVIMKNVDLTKSILEGVDFHDADLSGSIMTEYQFKSIKKSKFKNKPNII